MRITRCAYRDGTLSRSAQSNATLASAPFPELPGSEGEQSLPSGHGTTPDQITVPGLADNSVGRVIDTLLRNDLILVDEVGFAPLDDTGAQLLFRLVSAACERRALGMASHWPFDQWGRFLPEHTTAVSLLDNRSTREFPRSRPGRMAACQQASAC
jgi:IstB-like ATP binding protein